MNYNYKLDEQAITNIIKSTEKQKQIKLIIYNTKFKTSNLIIKNKTNSAKIHLNQPNVVQKFICPFQECLLKTKIILTLAIQPQHNLVVLLITLLK